VCVVCDRKGERKREDTRKSEWKIKKEKLIYFFFFFFSKEASEREKSVLIQQNQELQRENTKFD
jgi:hypothetical protein